MVLKSFQQRKHAQRKETYIWLTINSYISNNDFFLSKTYADYRHELAFSEDFQGRESKWVIVVKRQFSNFSAISWREQVNFQWYDDEGRFVLDQHAELDFYSASSLKQQFAGRHVAPQLGTHYSDSEASTLIITPPM